MAWYRVLFGTHSHVDEDTGVRKEYHAGDCFESGKPWQEILRNKFELISNEDMKFSPKDRMSFLKGIVQNANDNLKKLVYADWLEEHDEEEYAYFIRTVCQRKELPEEPPTITDYTGMQVEPTWEEGRLVGADCQVSYTQAQKLQGKIVKVQCGLDDIVFYGVVKRVNFHPATRNHIIPNGTAYVEVCPDPLEGHREWIKEFDKTYKEFFKNASHVIKSELMWYFGWSTLGHTFKPRAAQR